MTPWRLAYLFDLLRRLRDAGVRAALGAGRLLRLRPAQGAGARSGLIAWCTFDRPFDRGLVDRSIAGRRLRMGGLEAHCRAYDWSTITVTRRESDADRPHPGGDDAGRWTGAGRRVNWLWRKFAATLCGAAGPPGVRTAPC